MNQSISPKEFIEEYLIKQVGQIIDENHPYLAFALIASGIEFLGKCLNSNSTWDYGKEIGPDINNAINKLMPKYKNLNLSDELRNGLLHMLRPKSKLALVYKVHSPGFKNLDIYPPDPKKTVLEVAGFYADFKDACQEIVRRIDDKEFDTENKINYAFIEYD